MHTQSFDSRHGTVAGRFARLAGVMLLALAGCSSLQVYTAQNPAASFAGYRTYAHSTSGAAPGGFSRTPLTAAVLAKVQVDIDRELARKGYTLASGSAEPDLLVRSAAGRRTQERHVGGKILDDADWLDAETTAYYSEATLVIDVFDARTREIVWHGSSHRNLDTTPTVSDTSLAESVAAMLRPFPAVAAASPLVPPSDGVRRER